jgi:hypothetical protein
MHIVELQGFFMSVMLYMDDIMMDHTTYFKAIMANMKELLTNSLAFSKTDMFWQQEPVSQSLKTLPRIYVNKNVELTQLGTTGEIMKARRGSPEMILERDRKADRLPALKRNIKQSRIKNLSTIDVGSFSHDVA